MESAIELRAEDQQENSVRFKQVQKLFLKSLKYGNPQQKTSMVDEQHPETPTDYVHYTDQDPWLQEEERRRQEFSRRKSLEH